jgi:hypothetical protein
MRDGAFLIVAAKKYGLDNIMTLSPVLSLRSAMRSTLIANTAITGALGGPHVFDEAPRNVSPSWITFDDAQVRDWSTGSDDGVEQLCILTIWSQQRGVQECLSIAALVCDTLDNARLTLQGWQLVNLRVHAIDTRREANGRLARTSVRLRATMEKIIVPVVGP